MKKPKVALAHEFLNEFGGAEKTFEAISEIFPESTIYTAKYDESKMPQSIKKRNIICPSSNIAGRISKYFFTFLMAPIFEDMDFSNYDIIISDGNTWNKGIIVKPNQMHITYIHTPPRFLYGYSTESEKRNKWYFKIPFSYVDNILRIWDFVAAQRPDYILTNSLNVKHRIMKFYKRDSFVINPPVEINVSEETSQKDTSVNTEKHNIPNTISNIIDNKNNKPYFVAVGRLTKYKNFDLLIKTINNMEVDLVIVGKGSYEKYLKKISKQNIHFVGRVDDQTKYLIIQNSLGLINTVDDEDFGIVPLEAHACGKPVLAHKSGGHLETIIEDKNGIFFEYLNEDSLNKAILKFQEMIKSNKFDSQFIKQSVKRFSKDRFKEELEKYIYDKWEEFQENQNINNA